METLSEDTALIAFKAVNSFVTDLASEFGKEQHSLKLYQRLISKTQISHDKAIKKHLSIFSDFCKKNREAILEQDQTKLVNKKIFYSDRVYIDFEPIFEHADEDVRKVIWQHILTISATLDPTSGAKSILKKQAEENPEVKGEADLMSNLIGKIEETVKPDANPAEAVSAIMGSGIFTELFSGMQGDLSSGKLDMGKMMGVIQGMMSQLGSQVGDDPQGQQMMGMVNNMMGGLGNMGMAGPSQNVSSETVVEDVSENKEEKNSDNTEENVDQDN